MPKKEYTPEAKKAASYYAFGNLLLQLLLIAVIAQCVWLGKMGVHTLAQAKQHIFLPIPHYRQLVSLIFHRPKLVAMANPFIWPYVPYIAIILLANCVFSLKASRILRRGRVAASLES